MAVRTYTQEELEKARNALSELPDLSRDKISQAEMLDSLKDQIILLSSQKGYSIAEIKSALESVGVTVTAKAISELLSTRKRSSGRKKTNVAQTEAVTG
ncbi:mobilization protein [Pseudomonas sp. MAG002Y]|uniref:mobilization protein n=1 Tax=Pseudomonas sp. MAG002Y TaxID=2678690 RepID=UPI001C60DBAD|nr:mobilization protein [Pseudomonas sp. MAG002Y]MBW5416297.1 mobilization protein [Pseudomonas sp. MAG002Y]